MWLLHVCKVERAHSSCLANIYMFNSNNGDKWVHLAVYAGTLLQCWSSPHHFIALFSVTIRLQVAEWRNNDHDLTFMIFAHQGPLFLFLWYVVKRRTSSACLHCTFFDTTGCFSVISVLRELMISTPCAVTPALYFLCIIMAQVAGQEDPEKSTPLKGRRTYTAVTNGNDNESEIIWR